MESRPRLWIIFCITITSSTSLWGGVDAFSYVPMRDEHLFQSSKVIVVGRIASLVPQWSSITRSNSDASIFELARTDYEVDVDEVVRGSGSISTGRKLRFGVYGGPVDLPSPPAVTDEEGIQQFNRSSPSISWIPGAPTFRLHERVLLFLVDGRGPSMDINQFAMGSFHEVMVPGYGSLAIRQLDVDVGTFQAFDRSGATLRRDGDAERVLLRDFDSFVEYLKSLSHGSSRRVEHGANYFRMVDRGQLTSNKRYNLVASSSPVHNFRWTTFANGGSVRWHGWPATGQPGSPDGGHSSVLTAMSHWNSVSGVKVNYTYGGANAPAAGAGFSRTDGINTIVFDDAVNYIPGSYDCQHGGVLAYGMMWGAGVNTWRGNTWWTGFEGDVVIQNGISCWANDQNNPADGLAQLYTHELGHTLGFAHSCGDSITGSCVAGSAADQSIMRAVLLNNRGSALGNDDLQGIHYLYGTS